MCDWGITLLRFTDIKLMNRMLKSYVCDPCHVYSLLLKENVFNSGKGTLFTSTSHLSLTPLPIFKRP